MTDEEILERIIHAGVELTEVQEASARKIAHLDAEISQLCAEWLANHPAPPPPVVATSAVLTIQTGGTDMPGAINVDTTNETVTLSFVDDHGDTDAVGPAGAVVTFTSDNEAVVTVATDASNPLVGDISVVAEGTANIGATLANADGSPVLEADGVTAFPNPASVAVTVSAGPAVGDSLVLSV